MGSGSSNNKKTSDKHIQVPSASMRSLSSKWQLIVIASVILIIVYNSITIECMGSRAWFWEAKRSTTTREHSKECIKSITNCDRFATPPQCRHFSRNCRENGFFIRYQCWYTGETYCFFLSDPNKISFYVKKEEFFFQFTFVHVLRLWRMNSNIYLLCSVSFCLFT
jgi:hypothetical protein